MSTIFCPLCMLFSVILSIVIIPGKGDDFLRMCGQLSIDKPTISGRNVTFSFTPDTYSPNASLEWQCKSNVNQWKTLYNSNKYIQFKNNVNYYLILTNSVRNDETSYRVRYSNETSLCFMETRKLQLADLGKCGVIYLKSETVVKNRTVKFEYYPSDDVMSSREESERTWVHSYGQKSYKLNIANGSYEETPERNKYVLTIYMFSDSMNGGYSVYCGKELGYTDVIPVKLFVPPSNVTLEVKAIGDLPRQMNAKCTVYGYNPACNVQIRAPGGIFRPERSSKTITRNSVYEVNLNVNETDNGKDVTCVVECGKVAVDLTDTVKILLPNPPVIGFNISGSTLNISDGEQAHVKCVAYSVPASNISWIEELSNENITTKQCDLTPNCVLHIDANKVSNRRFICRVHYKTKVDHKYLTVHIEKAEEDKKYNNKQKTTGQESDTSILWIILGAGVLLVVIIVIAVLFIVFRKKSQTLEDKREGRVHHHTQEGHTSSEDRQAGNLEESEHALDNDVKENRPEGNLKQSGNDDEVPIYSQPIKKKTTETPDNIYAQVNKTRKTASSPSSANSSKVEKDGQLLYADLAFDPNAAPSKAAVAKQEDSPTEYVDIDYVKTKANKEIDDAPTEQENV